MKKLGKLNINPEKVMKNEELISLRGGTNCTCFTGQTAPDGVVCQEGTASTAEECSEMCLSVPSCNSYSFGGLY